MIRFPIGRILLAIAVLLGSAGCAGYRAGHRSMFRPDVTSVHIPVFESDAYRRNLGERLTESVAKEIEKNTPYKVVDSLTADTVLTGRVLGMTKQVISENGFDDPRDLKITFQVEVIWTDRRGNVLLRRVFSEPENFIPEAGQSLAVAQQRAIEQIARDVVTEMHVWW